MLSRLTPYGLAALVLAGNLLVSQPAATAMPMAEEPATTPSAPGGLARLNFYVALITHDLQVRPVPKHLLLLEADAGGPATEVVTGFDGKAFAEVSPGVYSVKSSEPVSFEGVLFSWDVKIEVPLRGATIELSTDNATREGNVVADRAPLTEAGAIFQKVRQSVFTVISEGGKGSGFLVDERGLVLTNHHVVENSDYLAVKPDEVEKYPAVLLASDPQRDVAVLLLNPAALKEIEPLPLARSSAEFSPVAVGERVLAIGSPLSTEGILTSGIVSKIETDAIMSDVNINPGNSGGPLLNMRGEVVGINTFAVSTGRGPGVSGIVRIHAAEEALAQAQERLPQVPSPSAERLPEASRHPFPADALARLASEKVKAIDYHLEVGKFDVQVTTPVLLASIEKQAELRAVRQQEKRRKKGRKAREETEPQEHSEGFYEWRRYGGDYRPVVIVQAVPEIRMTGKSVFAKIMLGNVPGRYRFKTDFDRMRLLRGDTEVAPLHPGKVRQVISGTQGIDSIEDIGVYGIYEYPPEAFEPGQPLVIEVYDENNPDKPRVREIPAELQLRIWRDFQPYFESLREAAAR